MSHAIGYNRVQGVMIDGVRRGTGWLPDPPDHRDRTLDDAGVSKMVDRTGAMRLTTSSIASSADLRGSGFAACR